METRYTVRQAVEMTGVKSYVLRYWEEELELQIHRNELGHRITPDMIFNFFSNIKELNEKRIAASGNQEPDPSDNSIYDRIWRKCINTSGRRSHRSC